MFRGQLSFLGDLTKPLITSCSSGMSASAKELRHRGSLASLITPFPLHPVSLLTTLSTYSVCLCVCVCAYANSVMSNSLRPPGLYVACQASLSKGFSRQEYWSGLPCPLPGDLPDPGIKPTSPASPALANGFFTTSVTWEALLLTILSEVRISAYQPWIPQRLNSF